MKPDFEDSSEALKLVYFVHRIVYFEANLTKYCLICQNFVFWPTFNPRLLMFSQHYDTL